MKKSNQSLIQPDITIHVFLDGSGGYYSRDDRVPVALAELVHDTHVREVMNREYMTLMRRRNEP